jgi:hypothetical protein
MILNSLAGRKNHLGEEIPTAVSGCVSGLIGMGAGIIGSRALDALRVSRVIGEIAPNFSGRIHRLVLANDAVAYRFSGGMAKVSGSYLTTESTLGRIAGSGLNPRTALNLPDKNLGTQLNALIIPRGTEIFVGRIAGGARWATQVFVQDWSELRVLW